MFWYIVLALHLILVLLNVVLALKNHEKSWALFLILSLIPVLGPLFVLFVYTITDEIEKETEANE